METINNIVICGGTHGNELTGVYLAKKHNWLLANPEAVAACRRYMHRDLNRCFAISELESCENNTFELARAREINALLGKKGSKSAPDLILDIHNTTANMGITLILSARDPLLLGISSIIATEFKGVHIYLQPENRDCSPYLGTIARRDICIEAGPQPHGTLKAELFAKVESVVFRILELARGSLPSAGGAEIFTESRSIDYPRDAEGNIVAMIHPALQGRDFCELRAGMPVFMSFDGKEILWTGETCYPAFINEAAYYEKGIAM
ncbi:MAG: aspartoacylase, partial [Fibromonadales bacterium]|nr:aspartoacylase [Fibromonadales bacterium]